MKTAVITTLLACIIMAHTCLPALADISVVLDRSGMPKHNSLNWAVLGPSMSYVPNPFTLMSAGGVSVTVSRPYDDFVPKFQRTQNCCSFPDGVALLNSLTAAPITFAFNKPVFGGGLYVQSNQVGKPYNAIIEAYDSLGTRIASFSRPGVSWPGDTVYLGVMSDEALISSLTIDIDITASTLFDGLDIVTVPELSSTVMIIVGVSIIIGKRTLRVIRGSPR